MNQRCYEYIVKCNTIYSTDCYVLARERYVYTRGVSGSHIRQPFAFVTDEGEGYRLCLPTGKGLSGRARWVCGVRHCHRSVVVLFVITGGGVRWLQRMSCSARQVIWAGHSMSAGPRLDDRGRALQSMIPGEGVEAFQHDLHVDDRDGDT